MSTKTRKGEKERELRARAPIGSLSKDVFEQRTSTGSEDFSIVICLDAM